MIHKLTVTLFIFINFWALIYSQSTGEITGILLDNISKEPLIGATIILSESIDSKGGITEANGSFRINDVAFGVYRLRIEYLGYENKEIYDVSIYDTKGAFIEISLNPSTQNLDEVVVAAYKNPVETTDPLAFVSSRSISIEETKRFAGSLGDPSRMALSYSGVNNGGGDNNELIIRGNSAKYMQWKLEGIEIPNPNHFGVYGSSGGLLSILNGSNLGRSNFYTGAFPAHTGNALAGVFDLSLRDGNQKYNKHSFQIGLIGISAASEGSIKLTKGANYVVNYRYSTLGLMKNLGIFFQAPEYQDLTFKVNLPTKKAGKFSIYGIAGLGTSLEQDFFRQIDSTQFNLNPAGDTIFGFNEIAAKNLNRYNIGIFGVKHILPLGKKHILTNHINYSSVFSVPRSSGYNRDEFTIFLQSEGRFTNTTFRYQPTLVSYINEKNAIHLGATLSFQSFRSKLEEGFPDFTSQTILDNTDNTFLGQSFVSYKNTSVKKLKIVAGIHYTFFNLNEQHIVEPRLSLDYTLSDKASLAFASGLHSTTESPEIYLIFDGSSGVTSRHLKMSRSWQTVLSYKRKLGENLFLTAELYGQYLFDVPIAADSSNFSLINAEVVFTNLELVNKGKGLNYGLEVTLEQFFSNSYYFLATASIFQSEYKLFEPFYRKTKYSNTYAIKLLGGKEFRLRKNKFLGLNFRSTFTGGKPFVPVLLEESIAANQEIRDELRANSQQLPAYISVDFSINYKWIKPKVSHELKLDIFRMYEQNYYDEVFVNERLNRDGSISAAAVQQVKYGEGQTTSTVLPVLYYRVTF